MAKADTKGSNDGKVIGPFEDAIMKKGGNKGKKGGK